MSLRKKKYGKLRRDLMARFGNPKTDMTPEGKPVESNYVVIVRVKDCEVIERHPCGAIRRVKTDKAPQFVKLNYGATYYGYTEWKFVKSKHPKKIKVWDGTTKIVDSFFRRIKYTVEDGKVYAESIYVCGTIPSGFKRKQEQDNTRNILIEKTSPDYQ